jgi:hypothetical protein
MKHTGKTEAPWGLAVSEAVDADPMHPPDREPDLILHYTVPFSRTLESDDMLTIGFPEAGIQLSMGLEACFNVPMSNLNEGENKVILDEDPQPDRTYMN